MSQLMKGRFIELQRQARNNAICNAHIVLKLEGGQGKYLLALSIEYCDLLKAPVMKIPVKNTAENLQGPVIGAISVLVFLTMASALSAQPQENWNCEETAYYNVYEDTSRTESKERSDTKTLKWIDANTIGFNSVSLERISPNSETYFDQNSASSLHINQDERPYLVVLTQPQVWMNKFGNLRVRFYRCTP